MINAENMKYFTCSRPQVAEKNVFPLIKETLAHKGTAA